SLFSPCIFIRTFEDNADVINCQILLERYPILFTQPSVPVRDCEAWMKGFKFSRVQFDNHSLFNQRSCCYFGCILIVVFESECEDLYLHLALSDQGEKN